MPKVIRGECVSCAGPGVPSLDFGQSCAPLFDSRQVVAVQTPQTPSVHAGTALERCTMHDIALFFFTINGRDGGETRSRRKRDVLPHTHGNDFRVARATTRAIYTVLGSVAFTRAIYTAWHRKPWNLHTMKKGGRVGKKKTKGRSEESLKNRDLQIFRVQWLTFTGHIE